MTNRFKEKYNSLPNSDFFNISFYQEEPNKGGIIAASGYKLNNYYGTAIIQFYADYRPIYVRIHSGIWRSIKIL